MACCVAPQTCPPSRGSAQDLVAWSESALRFLELQLEDKDLQIEARQPGGREHRIASQPLLSGVNVQK